MSERDADDGRQKFRRETHGQCQGEKQRIQSRVFTDDVYRQNNDYHHEHDAREQITETLDSTLKLCLWRTQLQSLGNLTEHCRLGRLHNQHTRGSTPHAGSHEHTIDTLHQAGAGLNSSWLLLHWKDFAGQDRLAHKQIVCFKDDPISRNQAARRKQDHIPGHHIAGENHARLTVTHDTGLNHDPRTQFLNRVAGPVFLHEAQCRATEHNSQHDHRVRPFPCDRRNNGREDKNQNQRTLKLVQQQPQSGGLAPGLD